jgi:hypothetical protein
MAGRQSHFQLGNNNRNEIILTPSQPLRNN